VTQPHLRAWAAEDAALRRVEQASPKDDLDPKALACCGLLLSCPAAPARLPEQVWLRFVDGRPISAVTTHYLTCCCDRLAQIGKTALLMVWDNASWHSSKAVRTWIKTHHQQVRQSGQRVRIVACHLPTKSPWLNPIEPHWMHGKRHVVESARLLTAHELADRVCGYFGCQHEAHLALTESQT
jgi:hypothetical protein